MKEAEIAQNNNNSEEEDDEEKETAEIEFTEKKTDRENDEKAIDIRWSDMRG